MEEDDHERQLRSARKLTQRLVRRKNPVCAEALAFESLLDGAAAFVPTQVDFMYDEDTDEFDQ